MQRVQDPWGGAAKTRGRGATACGGKKKKGEAKNEDYFLLVFFLPEAQLFYIFIFTMY